MTLSSIASSVVAGAGFVSGVAAILDWSLGTEAKARIRGAFETAWIWLADQRMGRFVDLIRKPAFQKTVVALTAGGMISILAAFLLQLWTGWNLGASFQLGQPRLYTWQVGIEILVLLAVAPLFTAGCISGSHDGLPLPVRLAGTSEDPPWPFC